jgi:hypothetical protein
MPAGFARVCAEPGFCEASLAAVYERGQGMLANMQEQ